MSLNRTETVAFQRGQEARETLSSFDAQRTDTPDTLKPFRTNHQPGVRVPHHGSANDQLPVDADFSFGVKTHKIDSAMPLLRPPEQSLIMQENETERERVYKSARDAPLGKGATHYDLPDWTQTEDFRFGSKIEHTDTGEEAKEVLYPAQYESDEELEDEATKQLYKTSHGRSDPGEQLSRNYDWKVDPLDFRFGSKSGADDKHVNDTLKWESTNQDEYVRRNPHTGKITKIVPKHVAEFRTKRKAVPGQSLLKQGSIKDTVGENAVFGEPSIRDKSNETTPQEVIFGYMGGDDLEPDADLGRSYKYNSRTLAKHMETVDTERTFGLPSIRSDKNPPKVRSLGDNYNYGDELDAHQTLQPHVTYERDLQERKTEAFTIEEITQILEDLYLDVSPEEIQQAFDDTEQMEEGKVALEDFKLSLLKL